MESLLPHGSSRRVDCRPHKPDRIDRCENPTNGAICYHDMDEWDRRGSSLFPGDHHSHRHNKEEIF
ncbi:hypothetical protein MT325_m639R [Paramecium bursaria chlorella virus MT325]|uniref:Uncharacterized protein m639R n=1 Tax=Paramecium bursaria Chlorella virus MT325 TaxID=346932 RepID=A7IV19_PBCVM|nr:hypothetical protein MT325_m639R [Paramecium bursaria chlorella virus MT325]